MVVPKSETPCKTEEECSDVEKDVDVEEFSDVEGNNVTASSSPSAVSEEDEEDDDDIEEEDDANSSKNGSQKNGKLNNSRTNSVHNNNNKKGKKKSRSEPVNHLIKPRCNCEQLAAVDCQLETKELWDKFHDLGTEMIITKTGRLVALNLSRHKTSNSNLGIAE